MRQGVLLNSYPDSLGGDLDRAARLLAREEMAGAIRSYYILPTLFDTDIDHGFSVIRYELNELLASPQALKRIKEQGIGLKMDFILNHLSTLSPQFRDVLEKGEASPYRDFFIDWNKFWAGCGEMTGEGYIQPRPELDLMARRKTIMPILFANCKDGARIPYWNTFYQGVTYVPVDEQDIVSALGAQYAVAGKLAALSRAGLEAGKKPREIDYPGLERYADGMTALLEQRSRVLGQMDLNQDSPLVWEFYRDTLRRLKDFGADMVRLDAFPVSHKAPGRDNNLNEPESWAIMERLKALTGEIGLDIVAEVHMPYETGAFRKLSDHGCTAYDFFLPGLVLDAMDTCDGALLQAWANELQERGLATISMLGCHDGIPLMDLKGLLPPERVEAMCKRLEGRGGLVKMRYGKTPEPYQMLTTYYSALGCDDRRLVMARAIQMFMPGTPQVWYLDLFAGKNDYEAIERDPMKEKRELNRTPLTEAELEERLSWNVVKDQLRLMRLRNEHPAFAQGSRLDFDLPQKDLLRMTRTLDGAWASAQLDLTRCTLRVRFSGETGEEELPLLCWGDQG